MNIKRFIVIFVLLAFFAGATDQAQAVILNPEDGTSLNQGIPDLFGPPNSLDQENLPGDTGILRERITTIDSNVLLANEELSLNLFENVLFLAHRTRIVMLDSGGLVWYGKIKGDDFSEITFAINGPIISGNIRAETSLYQVRFVSEGTISIRQIDPTSFPSELPPIIPIDLVEQEEGGLPPISNDDGSVVDILVVYTPDASAAVGGSAAMENLINLAIAETNTGYDNSGVNFDMYLVHTAETVYSEASFNWSTTLSHLRNSGDGYMDEVHTLRDTYSADLVSLIVNNTASCGIGYVMQTATSSFASYAFTVVSKNCATGYYSLAHETGHNMGSAHDRANASVVGVYEYSYGYQAPDEAFRTIMAYNCPGGCTRVNYWSNPDINYGGQPMGVIYTDPLAADNRRSLNGTAYTVSNFRVRDANPPSNPTNVDPGCTATNGVWQNTCSDPNFTWSGANDGTGSGVQGYYYYWGTSATGTPTTWTTGAGYNPGAVTSPSTYYLRLSTQDNAGNVSSVITLFTLKYDNTAPTSSIDGIIPLLYGLGREVQWSGSDSGSGLSGLWDIQYRVGSDGTWTDWLSQTNLDTATFGNGSPVDLISGQTYYFRVRTSDQAGNLEEFADGDGDGWFTADNFLIYLPITFGN